MKAIILITTFLTLNTLCFSQQLLIDETNDGAAIVVQKISPVIQSSETASADNLPVGAKSYVGTKAKEANASDTNSTVDLDSYPTHIGEKAREPQSSDVSYAVDPAMTTTHIGSKIEPK
jgi:hypothetical protein